MAKNDNLKDFLTDLYEGIVSKKPNASRNPQDFRAEIESIQGGSGSYDTSDSVGYYKANRNKNYPYFPLPSEIEDEQDTIYMLYGASGYMCCPAFNVIFTNCVCTVQKYMNTTLVSESVESLTSGVIKYMQFSEEDSDYNTYNYIVIKLQGSITKHYLNYKPKFNDIEYNTISSSELIEVSGKCVGCDIRVVNNSSNKNHQNLEYYSFLGVTATNVNYLFSNCYSLQAIPQLDTSKVTNMSYMFNYCYTLQAIPQLDTSKVTTMSYMFNYCYTLQTIAQLDTSKVINMSNMFNYCYLLQTIPQLDTSNVTDMSYMFYYCYTLQTIPQLDTSNVINMSNMFNYCYTLQAIPLLDTSNVTSMSNMFYNCYSLQAIPQLDTSKVTTMSYMFGKCYILVKADITNMKVSFDLTNSTMLSQSELVKILNNLATVETTKTLTLSSTNLAKLTDEQKAIATAKGWTLG